MRNNYQPANCATCNKEIFPHWKYCQEHTKNNIILDMDVNKFGVSLCKQENDRVWKLLEAELKAHAELKEQYAQLQENFHKLAESGIRKVLYDLSTQTRHVVE